MNALIHARSPYLLQHAQNPVHWQFWSEETLQHAKDKNQLLLISIGYAACHWCHIMEHECFEDQEVADLMNAHYTSIKIDREEHPEVDALYMKALQLMTRQGGWPLNIVALPDGTPIWGGTYVPKNQWIEILQQLQTIFIDDPEKVFAYAQKLSHNLHLLSSPTHSQTLEKKSVAELIANWQQNFDTEFGGYDHAPKFMMPVNLDFLQAYGSLTQNKQILTHVDTTLTRMAWGGLFDTVGGGFSRYAIDHKWHIPHFEKMLYDNAQLLKTYADAYKRTQNPFYKQIVAKTVQCIESDFKAATGGYYCALDADSLDSEGTLTEGAFYTWKKEELMALLGNDFPLFAAVFNINKEGYWEDGHYVLFQNQSILEICKNHGISEEKLLELKTKWEHLLLHHRKKRALPRIDDKILTSWNALLLSGYTHAYSILQTKELAKSIEELAAFITQKLTNSDGTLGHAYKESLYIEGLLEDYACTIQAFIDYYLMTSDRHHLQTAQHYTQWTFDLFYDTESHLFRSHIENKLLIAPQFEVEDNVIPSSNSVMCKNLFFLGYFLSNTYYQKMGNLLIDKVEPTIFYGSTHANWLSARLLHTDSFKHVEIKGKSAHSYFLLFKEHYLPHVVTTFQQADTETTFSVCTATSCLAPTSDFNEIFKLIQ